MVTLGPDLASKISFGSRTGNPGETMKPIGVDVGGMFTGIVFTDSGTTCTMDTGCTGRTVQLTVPK
jgi:hypothetical protein